LFERGFPFSLLFVDFSGGFRFFFASQTYAAFRSPRFSFYCFSRASHCSPLRWPALPIFFPSEPFSPYATPFLFLFLQLNGELNLSHPIFFSLPPFFTPPLRITVSLCFRRPNRGKSNYLISPGCHHIASSSGPVSIHTMSFSLLPTSLFSSFVCLRT